MENQHLPSHRLKGLGFVKTTRGVSADFDCSFCPPIRDGIRIDRDESSRKREHMFYTFLKHEYVQVESFLAKIWRSFFLEMNHTPWRNTRTLRSPKAHCKVSVGHCSGRCSCIKIGWGGQKTIEHSQLVKPGFGFWNIFHIFWHVSSLFEGWKKTHESNSTGKTWTSQPPEVRCLAVNRNGTLLASASNDLSVSWCFELFSKHPRDFSGWKTNLKVEKQTPGRFLEDCSERVNVRWKTQQLHRF